MKSMLLGFFLGIVFTCACAFHYGYNRHDIATGSDVTLNSLAENQRTLAIIIEERCGDNK